MDIELWERESKQKNKNLWFRNKEIRIYYCGNALSFHASQEFSRKLAILHHKK